MESFLGLPQEASQHAARIDNLLGLLHWLIFILAAGWAIYFIYVLYRFRAGRNPKANYQGVKTHASTYIEGGVAVAEGILLVALSIPLWSERVDAIPDSRSSVIVRVTAEQFAWNIHYPGKDGVFGHTDIKFVDPQLNPLGLDPNDPNGADDIVTLNQLHLPVNKPAIIYLSSKDVIHSFGIPEMRVKQDVIPGLNIPVWFVPTVTTEEMRKRKGKPEFNYEIACAQLCGIGHYRMRGFVTIDTGEGFAAWLEAQPKWGSGGTSDPWGQK